MSGVRAVCSCGWSQMGASLTDTAYLHAAHRHDAHGGAERWYVATSTEWSPPLYDGSAREDFARSGEHG